MERHFLSDFVDGSPEFCPEPWYNREGDCIIYQTANEAIVADRVDEFLTVYCSAQDNRPIGFQVKGVQAILKKFGYEGLSVRVEESGNQIIKISIAVLLLAAYEQGPRTLRRRRAYAGVMSAREPRAEISADELCPM